MLPEEIKNYQPNVLEKFLFKVFDLLETSAKKGQKGPKQQKERIPLKYIYINMRLHPKPLFFSKKKEREIVQKVDSIFGKAKGGKKSIREMTSGEFYDYIVDPKYFSQTSDQYLEFLMDYILISYLDGDLSDEDIRNILKLDNPFQINRYVDSTIKSVKTELSLAKEMAKYQAQEKTDQQSKEFLKLILPEYAFDSKKEKFKIKDVQDLKKVLKESAAEMEKQKRLIALAKMKDLEEKRQQEIRKSILARTPEMAELMGKDGYLSEENLVKQDAEVLYDELKRQENLMTKISREAKGKVIREAKSSEKHRVDSGRQEMSPAELIAYKKKLLNKLRGDIDKSVSGLDIKT